MAELILQGYGIAEYRSFGHEMQYSGQLKPVTLLAGQNNSGKSNFLNFLAAILDGNFTIGNLDHPQGSVGSSPRYAVAHRVDELLETPGLKLTPFAKDSLKEILSHESLRKTFPDELTWTEYEHNGKLNYTQFDDVIADLGNRLLERLAENMNSGTFAGDDIDAARKNLITVLHHSVFPRPYKKSVETIKAFRQIQKIDEGMTEGTPEGHGLRERLQRLQNPPAESYARDYAKFEAINRFLKIILEDDRARLEVRHDAQTLNVHHGGRILPLENLGTGVHQVVILAVTATLLENTIVCIEEPEVHLHPIFQRKFVRYLSSETNNQYLIATHSAHLLDYNAAAVLHVRHNGIHSELTESRTPADLYEVCADLGYRPSDLLQTNAIIWVEGPSDRVYLSHWIKNADASLIEGLHYSIMFYGGSLLNQLTSRDTKENINLSDFINLRRLNQNLVILIDSDKDKEEASINETKKRVRNEFDGARTSGFSWITDGYTIENYIPPEVLSNAVCAVHPTASPLSWTGDLWENPLALKRPNGTVFNPDKNRIAREVCALWVDPLTNGTPLAKMVNKCVDFINSANRNSVHERGVETS